MSDTLTWVRHRLDELVSWRDSGWSDADRAEYEDLCDAERWLLSRQREAV